MPQEFQVLRCYKCLTFQVHQVKKTNKYNCKLCDEKQSIKKVFGRGSGADCRKHVQKCNLAAGEMKEAAAMTLSEAAPPPDENLAAISYGGHSGFSQARGVFQPQDCRENDDEADRLSYSFYGGKEVIPRQNHSAKPYQFPSGSRWSKYQSPRCSTTAGNIVSPLRTNFLPATAQDNYDQEQQYHPSHDSSYEDVSFGGKNGKLGNQNQEGMCHNDKENSNCASLPVFTTEGDIDEILGDL